MNDVNNKSDEKNQRIVNLIFQNFELAADNARLNSENKNLKKRVETLEEVSALNMRRRLFQVGQDYIVIMIEKEGKGYKN